MRGHAGVQYLDCMALLEWSSTGNNKHLGSAGELAVVQRVSRESMESSRHQAKIGKVACILRAGDDSVERPPQKTKAT